MPALAVPTLIAAAAYLFLAPRQAGAQPPFAAPAPPPPAPPAVEAAPTPPAPPPAPPTPSAAAFPAPVLGPTDHDTVVGRWGIEARRLDAFPRSPGNDLRCAATNCPIQINSLSVRRWSTSKYAWSAGLALGVGGGSRYDMATGSNLTWDTYLGVGPTVSASFLLTNWRHLTVSLSPQLDAVIFIPRSTGSKTFLVNIRGLVEGEVHLGFIGLPEVSLGLTSGLVASLKTNSKAYLRTDQEPASEWNIGFSGPQSLWGLVTNTFLRFYF